MDNKLNGLKEFLLKLCEEFEKNNVKYVIIGGFAVILYGYTRFTQDIDIMIDPSEDNLKKIKKILKDLFNDDSFDEITSEDFGKYSVIRYGTPNNFYIDFIVKIGEVADFESIYKRKRRINFQNSSISIIDLNDLYKLKKDTVRDKDKIDSKFLEFLLKNKKESKNGI